MTFEGQAGVAEQGGDDSLGARIPPPNLRHDGATLLGRHDVALVSTNAARLGFLPVCGLRAASSGDRLLSRHSLSPAADLKLMATETESILDQINLQGLHSNLPVRHGQIANQAWGEAA